MNHIDNIEVFGVPNVHPMGREGKYETIGHIVISGIAYDVCVSPSNVPYLVLQDDPDEHVKMYRIMDDAHLW